MKFILQIYDGDKKIFENYVDGEEITTPSGDLALRTPPNLEMEQLYREYPNAKAAWARVEIYSTPLPFEQLHGKTFITDLQGN